MRKDRAEVTVTWNLDSVPGFNYSPLDVAGLLRKYLNETIPHYQPRVFAAHIIPREEENE